MAKVRTPITRKRGSVLRGEQRRWSAVLGGLAMGLALACAHPEAPPAQPVAPPEAGFAPQTPRALLGGQVAGLAYSPYRAGQHPDLGAGARPPTDAQLLEDLRLLARGGAFPLLRLYDASEVSARVLQLIEAERLPFRVMLGAWLRAEVSSHETCAWLDEPIPDEVLAANRVWNATEVGRAIDLARRHPSLVVAVNVGNEVLVDWNDHRVSLEALLAYLDRVRAAIAQPVTVAENYVPWTRHPELARAVDFAAVHTYPLWEGKTLDEALAFTVENLRAVQATNPGLPLVIGEAGWASEASEFPARATQPSQARYVAELLHWAAQHRVTTFVFEAFDESWKGNPADPLGAEKHWGLFDEARRPKAVLRRLQPGLWSDVP